MNILERFNAMDYGPAPEARGDADAWIKRKDFAKALGKELGRPSFLPMPGFAIDIVKGGGVGHAAREGQRVFPRKAIDNGYEFKQPELAGALANLLG